MSQEPLRVAVDAWNLPYDRRGIGRYVRAILRSWHRTAKDRVAATLIIPEWPAWLRAASYRAEAAAGTIPVQHRSSVRPGRFDVAWFPWNGMSWTTEVAAVATLHDASLFALPPADIERARQEQAPFMLAAQRARRVITDSAFSKSELERHVGLSPAAIEVVPLGVEPATGVVPARFKEVRRFLLFVGEPERRKGLDLFLEAAAGLPDELRQDLGIVLAGKGTDSFDDAAGRPRVFGLDVVSDERLHSLYAGAAALIYPSEYEGFGLPVLEAMAAGAPVIASDAGAVPEAGGDAALYFPSGDKKALARAIEQVLGDQALTEDLRARGVRRAAAMTWEQTADATLAVLAEAAKKR